VSEAPAAVSALARRVMQTFWVRALEFFLADKAFLRSRRDYHNAMRVRFAKNGERLKGKRRQFSVRARTISKTKSFVASKKDARAASPLQTHTTDPMYRSPRVWHSPAKKRIFSALILFRLWYINSERMQQYTHKRARPVILLQRTLWPFITRGWNIFVCQCARDWAKEKPERQREAHWKWRYRCAADSFVLRIRRKKRNSNQHKKWPSSQSVDLPSKELARAGKTWIKQRVVIIAKLRTTNKLIKKEFSCLLKVKYYKQKLGLFQIILNICFYYINCLKKLIYYFTIAFCEKNIKKQSLL
jgi:hypothetical protein